MRRRLAVQTKKKMLASFLRDIRPYQTGHQLIRIGAEGDGGYLVPDDLQGVTKCFSPGVDLVSEFERDCANRGMKVFLADASVAAPNISHPNFSFEKKFLGSFENGTFMTLQSWVSSLSAPEEELLLQMDIEGHEYEVLMSVPEDILQRFRIIVIEFHWLEALFLRSFFDLAMPAFKKLLKSHVCVHIHPNNFYPKPSHAYGYSFPHMAEFTFLRRDRIQELSPANVFPHPLDADCTSNKSLTLPQCWYRDQD